MPRPVNEDQSLTANRWTDDGADLLLGDGTDLLQLLQVDDPARAGKVSPAPQEGGARSRLLISCFLVLHLQVVLLHLALHGAGLLPGSPAACLVAGLGVVAGAGLRAFPLL